MSNAVRPGMAGGAATAAGTTFQEDVAAYFSTIILAESHANPPAGLPQSVVLDSIVCESPQPIDDIVVGTSDDGVLCVQAKISLSLSNGPDSEFAKVLGQFVAQYLDGVGRIGSEQRRPDLARDRFILAVGPGAPATITETLVCVLTKCRPVVDEAGLDGLSASLNAEEQKSLTTARRHIQRHWAKRLGVLPTVQDELALLHLTWVMRLDFRIDGAELVRAHDLLRRVVLRDESRSGDAWSALVSMCRTFGPQRGGGDLAHLRSELQRCGLPVGSVPSFREDIGALRKYTDDRLAYVHRMSFLEVGGRRVSIKRDVVDALADFAADNHTAVIGEPGAGKSGCIHDLATRLRTASSDVVLLTADMLQAASPEALASDLGLSKGRGLVDVLQNWSGDDAAYLIVDALDAARARMSLGALCHIIREAQARAPRWRVVVSIREYDLRASHEVQELFKGNPHDQFNDPRFKSVRHVRIDQLTDEELAQVCDADPSFASAIEASSVLRELVRNPFNLSLLCKLLDDDVSDAELSVVRTQVGLLQLYWSRRVETDDDTSRLAVLNKAVEEMVARRELHIPRQALVRSTSTQSAVLRALLSDGVLVEVARITAAEPVVGFAHNILFDYAVCRLWLDGLNDDAVARLSEPSNHDLLLAIRPSIVMAFEALWSRDDARASFWERAAAFERAPEMRLIGKIIAASVAAQLFRRLDDVRPLLDAIREEDASAVALLRFMVHAAVARDETSPRRHALIGQDAPDWMRFATELCRHLDQTAWGVRSLLWPMREEDNAATDEQALCANEAAVALVAFGIDNPRFHNVVRPGLEVAAVTIAHRPEATVRALERVLDKGVVETMGHEWLHPLSERLHVIAQADPEFALRIVETVFSASGDREAKVPMGGRILSFVMNKHDLLETARHDVQRSYSTIWERNPVTATKIAIRVMRATVRDRRARCAESEVAHCVPYRGGHATLKRDYSNVWAIGEHTHRDDWRQILDAFQRGLRTLAADPSEEETLNKALDTLRDEADSAVVWSAALQAGAEDPDTLGVALAELLCAPEVLAQGDTRMAAGDLIRSGFEHFSAERRARIEDAILRIPSTLPDDRLEQAEHLRNRILGCVPAALLQTPRLKQVRAELDASGGPPQNEPDYTVTTTWEKADDDWWLRRQGVAPEKPENAPLLGCIAAVKGICSGGQPNALDAEVAAAQFLPILQGALDAVDAGAQAGADVPLIQSVDDEIVSACERLAGARGLNRDSPLTVLLRATLRRAAWSERPVYSAEDDQQWDEDQTSWGSPSPRIDAALGLLRLAVNANTVDAEILSDIARLAADPVPAVRFQILAHATLLYHTAPELMWSLIENTCRREPRAGILGHFASNVLLRFPSRDYERLEPHVRRLFRHCRKMKNARSARQCCATYYRNGALWKHDRRAQRYLEVFADKPLLCVVEANAVVFHCRDYIRFSGADNADENKRVRSWAFGHLARAVKAALVCAAELRERHNNVAYDHWPTDDQEQLQQLHELALNAAHTVYFGSGAFGSRGNGKSKDKELPAPTPKEKARILKEGRGLFDVLCDVEFVNIAYNVLQTLEFLADADHSGVLLRIAALVRRAAQDGIQYESMAADVVVRIIERYLSEHGDLFRQSKEARTALLDILDVFVDAGWPSATRLTYRLGEVFR